jgi:hypothetical protein
MAPTPTDENNNLAADPTTTAKPDSKYWTKPTIAITTVFALLALAIFLLLLLFFLQKRRERQKRTHPKADKVGLLANDDKNSMFSRGRHSSVTLYVDSEADARSKRASAETVSLIPLQVTPLEEVHDPISNTNRDSTATASAGSGVSALSGFSSDTRSTVLLSPMSPEAGEGDMGLRPSGRPRSTSTASQRARYYESVPSNVEMPPVPKIVHTASD